MGCSTVVTAVRVACSVLLVLAGCAAHPPAPQQAASATLLGPAIEAAEPSSEFLELASTRPPRELADDAEVLVVSGYEPARRADQDVSVRVRIDRPGARVLLVLTSYDKVLWKVDATPGTTLAGVLVGSYHESAVSAPAPTRGWRVRLPYANNTESPEFRRLVTGLREMFGIGRIDAFRGGYSIPVEVAIREVDVTRPEFTAAGPRPVKPRRQLEFELLASDRTPVRWSLTGPLDNAARTYAAEGRLARSHSLQLQFRLAEGGLAVSDLRGRSAPAVVPLPPNFPAFSWAMDVAYDTRRDVAAVVSLGGEGFLYRFDAKHRRWIDFRSMRDIDVFRLSYDAKKDRYVGWAFPGTLLFIDAGTGAALSRRIADRLAGYARLDGSDSWGAPPLVLVPHGDHVMLVSIAGGQVRRIWHYDVQADTVEFTYSSDR